MKRRRRREGTGAIVRAIREQGDRIVRAIQDASAAGDASREHVIGVGVSVLRAALDDAAPRTFVSEPAGPGGPRVVTIHPRTANDAGDEPAPPTTPRGAPANDDEPPPKSGPRK